MMEGLRDDSKRWKRGVRSLCPRSLVRDRGVGPESSEVVRETAVEVQDRRATGLMARLRPYRDSTYCSSKLHSKWRTEVTWASFTAVLVKYLTHISTMRSLQ